MYSKVLDETNFNDVIDKYHYSIQLLKAKEKQTQEQMLYGINPKFEYIKPTNLYKTPEEWQELKEYADFLHDFFLVNQQTVNDQATVDLEKYMATPNKGLSIF
jgi:chitinase